MAKNSNTQGTPVQNLEFYSFCEKLFDGWRKDTRYFDDFRCDFEVDSLPEPYYRIPINGTLEGQKCLYVLNNNPGRSMPHQARQNYQGNASDNLTYRGISDKLGSYYASPEFTQDKRASQAASRIKKICDFASRGGFDVVECVETFFLHSEAFNKRRYLERIRSKSLAQSYENVLKAHLANATVLLISAIGTTRSIDQDAITGNSWLVYQMELIGMNLKTATIIPLSKKQGKVTAAFVVNGNKYMSLMMGSNNLPVLNEQNYKDILGI